MNERDCWNKMVEKTFNKLKTIELKQKIKKEKARRKYYDKRIQAWVIDFSEKGEERITKEKN